MISDASTAAMTRARFQSAHPELDFLLAHVAEDIQLSPTQYQKAVGHYTAVGEWLGAPGSPLALARPRLFPQGSMALGTTVSPWGRVEYDLDLVCEVAGGLWTPQSLFDTIYGRFGGGLDLIHSRRSAGSIHGCWYGVVGQRAGPGVAVLLPLATALRKPGETEEELRRLRGDALVRVRL